MLPIDRTPLPGTPHQQAFLRAITNHYAQDPRVHAVALFGSLPHGTWDSFSDLDLVILLADESPLQLEDEIQYLSALCARCEDTLVCVERDGDAALDLMLLSLLGVSLHYHRLLATPPEIAGSVRVLAGTLTAEEIRTAGQANQQRLASERGSGVDQFLRLAVEVDIALQRSQFWRAVQCLQLMRNLALSAYAVTHGGSRPFYFFQAHASPELHALLGATLPQQSLTSAQDALAAMLTLVDEHLALLTNGMIRLSDVQRKLIQRIRNRQSTLRHAEQRIQLHV